MPNTEIIGIRGEHVARGRQWSCIACPVALALAEVVGVVFVGLMVRILQEGEGCGVTYAIDRELAEMIRRYDRTGAMPLTRLRIDHEAKTISIHR